jgi:hypothetical protein
MFNNVGNNPGVFLMQGTGGTASVRSFSGNPYPSYGDWGVTNSNVGMMGSQSTSGKPTSLPSDGMSTGNMASSIHGPSQSQQEYQRK